MLAGHLIIDAVLLGLLGLLLLRNISKAAKRTDERKTPKEKKVLVMLERVIAGRRLVRVPFVGTDNSDGVEIIVVAVVVVVKLGAAGSRSRSPGSRIGRGFAHLLVVVVVGQGGPGAVAVAHQDRRVSGRRGAVAAPVPTGFGRRQLG